MSRSIIVVIILAFGAGSGVARADETTSRPMKTALLPVAGASRAVSEIDSGMGRALMGHGIRDTMGPRSLVARLSALDVTRRAWVSFRSTLKKAEKATLFMRRKDAVALSRKAIAIARQGLLRYSRRQDVAKAYEVLARALLLRPVDEAGALEALSRLVAVDPTYVLPEAHRNPRVKRLFRQARGSYAPRPPDIAQLDSLARRLGIQRVVWFALMDKDGMGRELQVLIHRVGKGEVDRRIRETLSRTPSLPVVKAVASKIAAFLSPPASPTSQRTRVVIIDRTPPTTSPASTPASRSLLAASRPIRPSPVPQGHVSRPWYKRWWVWTLVGVAVVGGATVATVAATSGGSSGYDFKFGF
ncbi:MAG: hypothetical protein KAI47_08200 [Deltaproteobacteria bacterium]|nr:hypothetical protein [Deltaproteobacteria bacterium]